MTQRKTGAQAVVRALRILKLFSGRQTSLSQQQVTDRTGLNRTTAFRLLSTLLDEGFLHRREDGDYQLGPALTALGGLANRRDTLRQIAHPILEKLVADTGERVTLELPMAGPDGAMAMLVIDEIAAAHRVAISEFAGNHLPIYATSTGKAFMAFLSQEKLDSILDRPMERFTDKTPVTQAKLNQDLALVRQQKYALVQEELEEGLVAVGAPVFDAQGDVCAAICIAGPTVRMTAERIPNFVQLLINSAVLISQRLGYQS